MAGLAISAAPAIYKAVKGIGQSNQANRMNPVNPGYQLNRGVINNAKTLSDYYGNYQLPGYQTMMNDINTGFSGGFSAGVKGATSGSDVLDLASKMAYGKVQATNKLGVETAQGKTGALGDFLGANEKAGAEYQMKNAYDRDIFQQQIKAKAALTQAGAENTYSAFDQLAGTASKGLLSMKGSTDSTADKPDGSTIGAPASAGVSTPTINNSGIDDETVDALMKKYFPNGINNN